MNNNNTFHTIGFTPLLYFKKMICLIAFITALSMAAAQGTAVTAIWNFGLDLGEYYPDRGGGGYHGTNGSSHLNTDKNVVS